MKKRIVINFIAIRGGGIFYAYSMVKALHENGNEILAIVSAEMDNLSLWRTLGIRLYIVKGYSTKTDFIPRLLRFVFRDGPRLRKMIRQECFEYEYIPMSAFWTPVVSLYLKRLKTVYTQHDPIPHDASSLIARVSNYCLKEANGIVVLSESYVSYVANQSQKPVCCIPLGPVAQTMPNSTVDSHVLDDATHFLFQGKILDYKGLDILAVAYRKLVKSRGNVSLLIAGSGDFSKYKALYDGLPNVVVENRWIDDTELLGYFSGGNVITVVPYKTATQSGIIPIANQCRSLVIASACGGLIEQVEDGVTGILVKPSDPDALCSAMEKAIDCPQEMQQLVDAAYNRINTYSWYDAERKLEDFMECL